jgi:hypothetical protein
LPFRLAGSSQQVAQAGDGTQGAGSKDIGKDVMALLAI